MKIDEVKNHDFFILFGLVWEPLGNCDKYHSSVEDHCMWIQPTHPLHRQHLTPHEPCPHTCLNLSIFIIIVDMRVMLLIVGGATAAMWLSVWLSAVCMSISLNAVIPCCKWCCIVVVEWHKHYHVHPDKPDLSVVCMKGVERLVTPEMVFILWRLRSPYI